MGPQRFHSARWQGYPPAAVPGFRRLEAKPCFRLLEAALDMQFGVVEFQPDPQERIRGLIRELQRAMMAYDPSVVEWSMDGFEPDQCPDLGLRLYVMGRRR